MDFKEILRKISLPQRTKENDRDLIKEEKLYIDEIQMLVIIYLLYDKLFYSFVIKITILFQQDLKQKKKMVKKRIMEKCLLKNMENNFIIIMK